MSRARDLSKLSSPSNFTVDANNNIGVNSTSPDAKLDVIGIVSATSFFGDGSGLSGVGAQVAATDDSTPSGAATLPLVFTSGAASAANLFVDPGELSFNPGTNALYVTGGFTAGAAIAAGGNISATGSITATQGITGSSVLTTGDVIVGGNGNIGTSNGGNNHSVFPEMSGPGQTLTLGGGSVVASAGNLG